jgi:hypothetical protein
MIPNLYLDMVERVAAPADATDAKLHVVKFQKLANPPSSAASLAKMPCINSPPF